MNQFPNHSDNTRKGLFINSFVGVISPNVEIITGQSQSVLILNLIMSCQQSKTLLTVLTSCVCVCVSVQYICCDKIIEDET